MITKCGRGGKALKEKIFSFLPFWNMMRRGNRSFALAGLVALLAFTAFAGTIIVTGLQNGMDSLEKRLGADIMVIPENATMDSDLESIILQGNTGYFYMGSEKLDEVASLEGIGEISQQLFLASANAGCCSMQVQIMGFDPQTDFTISPWVKDSYDGVIQEGDVIMGCNLMGDVGEIVRFYDVKCRVVAKLAKTGTGYDNAVFANEDTLKQLIQASVEKGLNTFGKVDPSAVISCILLNVKSGYEIDDMVNTINVRIDGVKAIRTTNLTTGISSSLSGIAYIMQFMISVVWSMLFFVLMLSFTLMVSERKKEFAILRAMGVSRNGLVLTVLKEILLIGLAGGVIGVVLGFIVIVPFGGMMEEKIGLPLLLPCAGKMIFSGDASIILSSFAGTISSLLTVCRISRIDPSLILREEH